MRSTRQRSTWMQSIGVLLVCLGAPACSSEKSGGPNAAGAGASVGGAAGGGAAGSSIPTGGMTETSGGAPAGGTATVGVGGASGQGGFGVMGRGGAASSGGSMADAGAGGSSGAAGAEANGGAGGATFSPAYILGADISSVQESKTTFRDTDGQTKTIFEVLKNHGFNYVRLKTFVDPSAPYGYASKANGCAGLPEPYGDRDHVVTFGKQVKAAGMGLLLDFHYSDTWADPGNQIVPDAWRDAGSIAELASRLKAYTKDVLTTAINAGARPDMVQLGNEITPGLLVHVPGPDTDCYGNNPEGAPISGSTSNWNELAALLTAGSDAVHEVDPGILVMLHIENTRDLAGVERWVDGARMRNVPFDVLGLSCYTAFQGQPSVWKSTFEQLATSYPDLKFAIAEYNPDRTEANRIMKALPNGRGLGTFFWEPTRSGEWGESMFTFQGGTAQANAAAFSEFDALRPELGL